MPARTPRIVLLSILLTVAFFSGRTAVTAMPNLDGVGFFDRHSPDGKAIRDITPDLTIHFAMSDE